MRGSGGWVQRLELQIKVRRSDRRPAIIYFAFLDSLSTALNKMAVQGLGA